VIGSGLDRRAHRRRYARGRLFGVCPVSPRRSG